MSERLCIMLDPGHGGKDPGAVYDGLQESVVVAGLAVPLTEILTALGHKTILSRPLDQAACDYTPPFTRANLANQAGVDLFLSLHCNAFTSPKPRGIRFYVPGPASFRQDRNLLSWSLADKLRTETKSLVRRIPTGGIFAGQKLTVLKRTQMPAVLLELGFLSNVADRAGLRERELIMRSALACALAVDLWAKHNAGLAGARGRPAGGAATFARWP